MEVTKIVINGIEITTIDKPIGLEVIKLSLDRDFQYSCLDTKIEAELKFYCASGKTELDAEYESKGVEATGYIEITDTCGTNAQTYRFNLDFKKYSNQGEFTTIGLIDVNSLWKKDLEKEVNLKVNLIDPTILDEPEDFYIRNLPLVYTYASENVYAKINQDTLNLEHTAAWIGGRPVLYNTSPPVGPGGPAPIPPNSIPYPPFGTITYYQDILHYIMPRVDVTRNDLENSDGLLMDYFNIDGPIPITTMEFSDVSGTVSTITNGTYSETEPEPIFENSLSAGEFTINTFNDQLILDLIDITSAKCELAEINEIISLGKTYSSPRYIMKNQVYASSTIINTSTPTAYTLSYNKSISLTLEVKEQEKVWVYYEVLYKQIEDPAPVYDPVSGKWQYYPYNQIQFKNVSYVMSNTIDIEFKLTKDVKAPIVNASEIVPYHTKTKAYKGFNFLNKVFGTIDNIADSDNDCFSDLWFSRGDYIRGKINVADFIVKPSEFFRELEKVVCCGLGYFYDTDPAGEKRLMSVYDFYSDTLVPSQYQFSDTDLIDGIIEIAPFLAPYYKEIQIGYSNSKDSPKELCAQNDYSIDNDSDSNYSKVSDFIASQYIINNALRLGTVDEELEFDRNIFILSGTTVSGSPTDYNVTLSQTSGFLGDNVIVDGMAIAGINKRYATAFNLFRHLYKWGFSLFANKEVLTVNKYKGSTIYNGTIISTLGTAAASGTPYQSLNQCKLPRANAVRTHQTISGFGSINTEYNLYVPSQITFKTAKLSSLDLIAMRAHQYDLFSVSDGVNTYYGNLISANLEDDVTEIKLLRRFKDGII
jgi:hypothetical protein